MTINSYPLGTPEQETALALKNGERLPGWNDFHVKTVLDIGASVGSYAANWIVRPGVRVICVEPHLASVQLLEAWRMKLPHDQATRLQVHKCALGNVSKRAVFIESTSEPTTSSMLQPTRWLCARAPSALLRREEECDLWRLDDLVANQFAPIRLEDDLVIKLDVQGYEDRVIEGGMNTFARARAVQLELMFDKLYEGQATIRSVLDMLEPLGFRFAGSTGGAGNQSSGALMWQDLLFVK